MGDFTLVDFFQYLFAACCQQTVGQCRTQLLRIISWAGNAVLYRAAAVNRSDETDQGKGCAAHRTVGGNGYLTPPFATFKQCPLRSNRGGCRGMVQKGDRFDGGLVIQTAF